MTSAILEPLDDTLEWWHPTLAEPISEYYLDWGPVGRGTSDDRPVRLRNASPNYRAEAITVSVTEFGFGDPARSVAAQHLLSLDGQSWAATLTLAGLGPREVSERLYLRRVVAPDADYGPGEFQLLARVGAWR